MNGEQWDAFLGTLSRPWREIAQAIMRRVNYILNADRKERQDEIQAVERRLDRLEGGGGAGG